MINKSKQIILFLCFAVPKFVDKVRKKEGQGRIKVAEHSLRALYRFC